MAGIGIVAGPMLESVRPHTRQPPEPAGFAFATMPTAQPPRKP
jgi:hypothetical protein